MDKYAIVEVEDYPTRHVMLSDPGGISFIDKPYQEKAQDMFYELGDRFGYGVKIPMVEVDKYREKYKI